MFLKPLAVLKSSNPRWIKQVCEVSWGKITNWFDSIWFMQYGVLSSFRNYCTNDSMQQLMNRVEYSREPRIRSYSFISQPGFLYNEYIGLILIKLQSNSTISACMSLIHQVLIRWCLL